ncbi:hypothetical protein [Chamaesiphon polymorphus]|uniref:Uncharacterized protein n=1 Tax=Chamaesiphon polymorphus CCALA 037 TaxID=2107692 RepID=A0A2T1GHB9_9CYAN|nr:hypothetical protein [Chamaesiphon polymorphus]PSB57067.1 hypothetical protein C7B77_09725 [Chamaesiphon polymorphus CCALA 037]
MSGTEIDDRLDSLDDYEYESVASKASKSVAQTEQSPDRDSLGYLLRQEAKGIRELAQKTVDRHQISDTDPVAEVLQATTMLTNLVGRFENHTREILDSHGNSLEERIAQTVRTNIRQNDAKLSEVRDALKESGESLDRTLEILTKQFNSNALDRYTDDIVAKISISQGTNTLLKQVLQNEQTLVEVTNKLDTIKSPPIQTHIQQIPWFFYAIGATMALTSVIAAGLTWKKVDERVAVENWLNSPDGKLARQIVVINRGGLTAQCKASTRKLNTPVPINGIDRDKLCFVAIP